MSKRERFGNAPVTDEYFNQVTLDVLNSTASNYTGVCDHKLTELHPDDIYNLDEEAEIMFWGRLLTLEEKDNAVKRFYKKEFWPERLKKEKEDE